MPPKIMRGFLSPLISSLLLLILRVSNHVRISEHLVVQFCETMTRIGHASVRVRAQGSAEEENERLRLVDFIVDPAARLLHAQLSPLLLKKKSALWELLVDGLGKQHMAILKIIICVLFTVFDFVREMWHFVW